MPRNLSQLPQLFRGPFLRKVALGNYWRELQERLETAGIAEVLDLPLADIFERVYQLLLTDYRCEYVYKNAITQNWFLSRHSIDRSHITDEFRVGKSRVDLAIFSNTSVAFEIKTELDSTARLSSQSEDYIKVFDQVFIVTSPSLTGKVMEMAPKTVGVLELTESGRLKMIRPSESHGHNTSFGAAFACLRQAEMLSIVKDAHNMSLDVPSSRVFSECKNLMRHLLPFEMQAHLVHQLRGRRYPASTKALIDVAPPSLKHATLTLRASQREAMRIKAEFRQKPSRLKIEPTNIHEHLLPLPKRQAERVACA